MSTKDFKIMVTGLAVIFGSVALGVAYLNLADYYSTKDIYKVSCQNGVKGTKTLPTGKVLYPDKDSSVYLDSELTLAPGSNTKIVRIVKAARIDDCSFVKTGPFKHPIPVPLNFILPAQK